MRPIGRPMMNKKEAGALFSGIKKVGKSLFPKRGKAKAAYQRSK